MSLIVVSSHKPQLGPRYLRSEFQALSNIGYYLYKKDEKVWKGIAGRGSGREKEHIENSNLLRYMSLNLYIALD